MVTTAGLVRLGVHLLARRSNMPLGAAAAVRPTLVTDLTANGICSRHNCDSACSSLCRTRSGAALRHFPQQQRWITTSAPTRSASTGGGGRGGSVLPSAPTWSVKSLIKSKERGSGGSDGMDDEVTREDVVRLGKLSHLPVDDADVDQLQDGLVQLLDFTRQVQAVNTEGVEPLHTVLDGAMPLRPDVAKEQGNILGNAPQEFERFFVAPLEKHFDGAEEEETGRKEK